MIAAVLALIMVLAASGSFYAGLSTGQTIQDDSLIAENEQLRAECEALEAENERLLDQVENLTRHNEALEELAACLRLDRYRLKMSFDLLRAAYDELLEGDG